MSSSSKRLRPVFGVRVGFDASVPADVLSPIRSTRAELVPPASDGHRQSEIIAGADTGTVSQDVQCQRWRAGLLVCGGVAVPSLDTSSPFTSCRYKLMTCVRLSLACRISADRRKKKKKKAPLIKGHFMEFFMADQDAHPRRRRCPLCRWPT